MKGCIALIIDVDNPRWLDFIRMINLVNAGIVTYARVSSSKEGLHLFTRENYYEPIECESRKFYRELLGFEITFTKKGSNSVSPWVEATMKEIISLFREVT